MIKLLFDIEKVLPINIKNSNRSGVFWVSYNLLEKFRQDKRFEITLFSKYGNNRILNIISESNYLKQFDYKYKYWSFLKNDLLYKTSVKSKNFDENYYDAYLNTFIEDTIDFNIKQFYILHDTTPIIYKDFFNNDFYNKHNKVLNKNVYGFCVSNNTRNDFLKYFSDNLDENKLFIMPIASSQNFHYERNENKLKKILEKYNVNNKKYIFSLCTLEPRKNLIFTIKCFIKFIQKHNINDLYFYLGGGQWKEFFNELQKEVFNLGDYKDKILKLGYVDDEDLNILYNHSLFFTYISKYEGFGMPPLEAMMCGTPVITSNTSSIPEVVGDSAIKIDPENEEECIKAMEDFYFNEKLREEYSKKGLERAKLFSWDKTYKILSDKILEVCK